MSRHDRTYITQQDFQKDRKYSSTYRITKSGHYILSENIKFSPKENKISAILVDDACDVILDLNGKVLKQSHHCRKSQIDGIVVNTGSRNITILGNYAVIKNFSRRGIYVKGGTENIIIGNETQLTVTGCGYGTERALVDVVNGNEEGAPQAGLQLGDMEFLAALEIGNFNGLVRNLTVSNVLSTKNNFGCALGEGSNYQFTNCSFSENLETRLMWEKVSNLGGFYQPQSVVCYGLVYFSNPDLTPSPNFGIQNVKFEGCRFNQNMADASETSAEGSYCDAFIMAVNFKGLKVRNCQFNSNSTKIGTSGRLNQTRGLVLGAGAGTVIEDSEFSQNVGGSIVNGFNLSGLIATTSQQQPNNFPAESVTLRNCVAAGNLAINSTTLSSVEVIGFSIRYPSGVTLIDCVAEDNRTVLTTENQNTTAGFADGIFIFSDQAFGKTFSNNIELRGCKLSRNRVVNGISGTSSGVRIYDDLCENIVVRNCVISDNKPDGDENANPPPPSFYNTGVDLFNEFPPTGPTYANILDNVIQSNGYNGVDTNLTLSNIQGNNISFHTNGVTIQPNSNPNNPPCGSVLDNTFISNGYAVYDFNEPSTTLVAGNKGYNNPCGYYVVYDGGVPTEVALSVLPNFPAQPTLAWSNIEIDNRSCSLCAEPKKVTKSEVDDHFEGKKALLKKRLALYNLKR